jgi:exopolysaccharide biosynthesis polyprenyl glycosylphosphotransferase
LSERDTEILALVTSSTVPAAHSKGLNRPFVKKLAYLGTDLAALILAHMVAVRFIQHFLGLWVGLQNPSQYHRYYIPFFAAVLYLFEGYKSPELRRPERELELGFKAVFTSFVGLMVVNFLVFKTQVVSRYLMVIWFALSCVFLITGRALLRMAYSRPWKSGVGRKKTLLFGSPAGLCGFQQLLSIQRHQGYDLMGLVLESNHDIRGADDAFELPVLGSLDDWENVVVRTRPDVLIVALPSTVDKGELFANILNRARELQIEVQVYSKALAASELNFERDEFSGCLRFSCRPRWAIAAQRFLKNGLDLAIGLVGSAVTVLLIPVIGLMIKLHDGGPVFYRSAYLGQDRRNRYYLKFRTMRVDADRILNEDPALKSQFSARHKLEDDPRVTALGRFLRRTSLDEFPQFFSLLLGKLSFVGPRTIRQEEGYRYGVMLPRLLSVKPGMTGFWQVMGRQTTTYQERVQMDLFYIEHWSIWFDLFLIGKTFWKVLKAEGAY